MEKQIDGSPDISDFERQLDQNWNERKHLAEAEFDLHSEIQSFVQKGHSLNEFQEKRERERECRAALRRNNEKYELLIEGWATVTFGNYQAQDMSARIPAKPSREKIEDAITEKVDLLQPTDSVQKVSEKMVAFDTNVLPVSEGGHLIGLADMPNPGLDASSHGHDPQTTPISETMNRDIVFCYADDDCAGALHKMEKRRLSHLPVVDREMRIVGLVACEDLNARMTKATADHIQVGTVG